MANIKISELAAASALDGTETMEAVQGGTNKKATAAQVANYARTVGVNNQTGTSYNLVLADFGKAVRCANAAAITVNLPANATVAYPVGASIPIRQAGAGQITVIPAGGVTLNTPTGFQAVTGRQHATIMLHKVAADEWDITGDLAAV